ncbi:MAG: hypothetical protein AABY86_12130, partial [Bdellovibrionota bacterium]
MRLKYAKISLCLLAMLGVVRVTEANPRVEWVRDQGFPYLLTYAEQDTIAKYCYGEVIDFLSNKKTEILCRAIHDGKCPVATDCYRQ